MLPLGVIVLIIGAASGAAQLAKTTYELTHEVVQNNTPPAAMQQQRQVIDMTPVETNLSLDGK